MKLIPLTQSKFAQVDDEDFDWLSKWKWCYSHGYAKRVSSHLGKKKTIYMHKEISLTSGKDETDHRDRNGLNNQRGNLRVCTHSKNLKNMGMHINNTTGFKGVSWDKKNRKWRAVITVNGKYIHIGRFGNSQDAARAYNDAARRFHGEFACLNSLPNEKTI